MESYTLQKRDDSAGIQTSFEFLKMMGVLLGMICIVIGLVFSMKLFFMIYGALENPEGIAIYVQQWGEILGGKDLTLTLNGDEIPFAKVTAVSMMGSATMILVVIALGLISSGAKLVSWILFDRETVKRVLKQALRNSQKEGFGGESN